jgi:hypothetical protein
MLKAEIKKSREMNCVLNNKVTKERRGQKSARGLAQSTTLSRVTARRNFRQVLDCASPLALSAKLIPESVLIRVHLPASPKRPREGGWLKSFSSRLCPSSVARLLRRVDAFALGFVADCGGLWQIVAGKIFPIGDRVLAIGYPRGTQNTLVHPGTG